MLTEASKTALRNYIERHKNDTDEQHIRLVSFATRRLMDDFFGDKEEKIPTKWDTTYSSAGRVSRYVPPVTPPAPVFKSIFRSTCRSVKWRNDGTVTRTPWLEQDECSLTF